MNSGTPRDSEASKGSRGSQWNPLIPYGIQRVLQESSQRDSEVPKDPEGPNEPGGL
jgi:hypothetical protein